MIQIFSKKMAKIPGDNGSSLNIPITIKIITLTNITLIGGFPPELTLSEHVAEVRDTPR
jgi:hypothetical protein